ncbi:MAG: hypothetical protein ABSG60_04560, partial [Terracidiphilus sp.]
QRAWRALTDFANCLSGHPASTHLLTDAADEPAVPPIHAGGITWAALLAGARVTIRTMRKPRWQ